jgi:ribose/xylose/arabinose/galactoside ABC-type transport system permease subunit
MIMGTKHIRAVGWLLYRLLSNRVYFLLGVMIVVVVIMSGISPYFFALDNMLGMTRFGAVLALVALGQTLIIVAGGGGIDLSVGSMVSLCSVVIGLASQAGLNIWVAALTGVLAGLVLGAVNGVNVVWIGIPPLIGTLGTLYTYGALALVLTGGVPISGFPDSFGFIGQGDIFGVPAQVVLLVLPAYLMLQFVASKTVFGRRIYLTGVNETAARFAGIPVKKVRFVLYTLSGVLAGLGAVVMTSWLLTARPDIGSGLELQSITVAVLGGTNIFGGEGTLHGTILAVLIVTMVASGLQLANINPIWQLAVLGFILLGAVALNQSIGRLTMRRRGAISE